MGKTAFIFPGQGAQYVGMAREFHDTYGVSRRVFEQASGTVGFSMEAICFEENEKINETRYTQPALLTACCSILAAVEKTGLRADFTAGLSLGEYCALTAAGALRLEDAVQVVCRRGAFMSDAVKPGEGAMMAVLSRKPLDVEGICRETGDAVWVANYNCPGQQVISGRRDAVETAAARLLEAGASRVVPLKVSGPFHSPLLEDAGKQLRRLLDTVEITRPAIPFVSNVTASEAAEPEQIRELLGRQVYSPVRWQQSMEYMIRMGVDTFVEIGPGRTLNNFVRKFDRSLRVLNIEKPDDLSSQVSADAAIHNTGEKQGS